jgi:hypothetical protein
MRIDTRKHLAAAITNVEGKKSIAKIGDVEEILKILVTMEAQHIVDDPDSVNSDSPLTILRQDAGKLIPRLKKKKRG